MAQTPNLKLNLFNGSDKPNYELFNDNNEKIDTILNNAKTHNHDGINSSKIKATSVVFNSGDTTLQANNLEDAVKEVFTEADNKITWITNAIGKTSSGVSNPDIRVDEIKADFDAARDKYLDNVKRYTLFNLNGYSVASNSSINDIAEAISNTTFKNATATKDDMLTTAHGVTKNGIVEYGTIEPIDYLMIKPNTYSEQKISKGMYKQLYLVPFTVDNPALHIKKGCNILGIQGMLSDHGSNGWDVEDDISKSKLTTLNTNGAYFSKKGDGYGAYSSLKNPVSISNGNGGYITVQHFKYTDNGIACYTPDLKQYVTISITAIDPDFASSGSLQKNYITTKRMFKVFKQKDSLYAAIALTKKVYIVELFSKKIMYKYPASDSILDLTVSEIMIPKEYDVDTYNICFIGEEGFISCQPVYDASGTAIKKWKGYKKHGLDFKYTKESTGAVSLYPKESTVSEQSSSYPTEVVKANMIVEDGTVTLNAGDELTVSRYLSKYSTIELVYSVPMGGTASTIQLLNDDDSIIDQIQTSSSATTVKTINIGASGGLTIKCTAGKIKITGIKVAEAGYADTRNKLFSQDWGYIGGRAILNTVEVNNSINEAYVLFGGHEKTLDEGKCNAIYSVAKFSATNPIAETSFFDLGPKTIIQDMFAGKDPNAIETLKIHRCLCFMSEYDNYIFGTFPDTRHMYSEVSATGTRYFKFNRRLIKLNFSKSGYRAIATMTESTRAFVHKQFKPMFINHLGQVIGLEQSCTLEKFTYFTKLNSNLVSVDAFEDWSEVEWRTASEEFKILDDGNALNKIKMVENVTRLYDTNGNMSNTKIIGTVLTAPKDDVRSTQASMVYNYSDNPISYTTEQGLLSLYNPIYKINGTRE